MIYMFRKDMFEMKNQLSAAALDVRPAAAPSRSLPTRPRWQLHNAVRCERAQNGSAAVPGELPALVRSPAVRAILRPAVAEALRACASRRRRALEAADGGSERAIEAACDDCVRAIRSALRRGEFPAPAVAT